MIVTDGGRFGGYAMFLSPAFNWWSHASFFRNLGLGFLLLGLLLVWRGRSKDWGRFKMFMSYIILIPAALLVFACIYFLHLQYWPGQTCIHLQSARPQTHYLVRSFIKRRKTYHRFRFQIRWPGTWQRRNRNIFCGWKEVSRNYMEHCTPITFPEDESFDVGSDTRSGVSMLKYRYEVPFRVHRYH